MQYSSPMSRAPEDEPEPDAPEEEPDPVRPHPEPGSGGTPQECQVCASNQWCNEHSYLNVARARFVLNDFYVLTHNEKLVLRVGVEKDDFLAAYRPGQHERRAEYFTCESCGYRVWELRSTGKEWEPCLWCTRKAHEVWDDGFSLGRLWQTSPESDGVRGWPLGSLQRCPDGLRISYEVRLHEWKSSGPGIWNRPLASHFFATPGPEESEPELESPSPEPAVTRVARASPMPLAERIRYVCPRCDRVRSGVEGEVFWWCLGCPGMRD